MPGDGSDVGSRPVVRSWSIVDFAYVWFGGFLGAAVFFGIGSLFESSDLAIVVFALAGQYIGTLSVLWILKKRKEDGDLGFSIETRDTYYIGLGLILQLGLALLLLPLAEWLFPDGRPPQQVAEALADRDASLLLRVSLIGAAVVLAMFGLMGASGGILLWPVVIVHGLIGATMLWVMLSPSRTG